MTIKQNSVVSIHYTLTDDAGETLDSSIGHEPLQYLQGAKNIIPGLEDELMGKNEGDELKVTVQPENGYGEIIEQLVQEVPRSAFADVEEEIKPGMQFQADTPNGPIPVIVIEANEDTIKLDGNHPLAGKVLHFDVKVESIRDASAEELEHGHVHGPGGHQH